MVMRCNFSVEFDEKGCVLIIAQRQYSDGEIENMGDDEIIDFSKKHGFEVRMIPAVNLYTKPEN
jgi:hypothetical protein